MIHTENSINYLFYAELMNIFSGGSLLACLQWCQLAVALVACALLIH